MTWTKGEAEGTGGVTARSGPRTVIGPIPKFRVETQDQKKTQNDLRISVLRPRGIRQTFRVTQVVLLY